MSKRIRAASSTAACQRRPEGVRAVAAERTVNPLKFSLEIVAGLAIVTLGAWMSGRINDKVNRQAQAGERIAAALERAYPVPKELPPPDAFDVDKEARVLGYWRSGRDGAWQKITGATPLSGIMQFSSHKPDHVWWHETTASDGDGPG